MGLDALDRGELLPTLTAYQVLGLVLTRIQVDGGIFCSILTARKFSVQHEDMQCMAVGWANNEGARYWVLGFLLT